MYKNKFDYEWWSNVVAYSHCSTVFCQNKTLRVFWFIYYALFNVTTEVAKVWEDQALCYNQRTISNNIILTLVLFGIYLPWCSLLSLKISDNFFCYIPAKLELSSKLSNYIHNTSIATVLHYTRITTERTTLQSDGFSVQRFFFHKTIWQKLFLLYLMKRMSNYKSRSVNKKNSMEYVNNFFFGFSCISKEKNNCKCQSLSSQIIMCYI